MLTNTLKERKNSNKAPLKNSYFYILLGYSINIQDIAKFSNLTEPFRTFPVLSKLFGTFGKPLRTFQNFKIGFKYKSIVQEQFPN